MNNLDKPIVITSEIMKNEFGYDGAIKKNRENLVNLITRQSLDYHTKQIKDMNEEEKSQVCSFLKGALYKAPSESAKNKIIFFVF